MSRSRQDLPPRPPRPRSDLTALRAEHVRLGVGPLIVAEVRSVAYDLVPRYNAAVYSEIGNWRHGLDDLVQDVVADSLLRDRQVEFMLAVAPTIDDFRRLLVRQVRRRLARRRTRTIVDNLLDRSRPLLGGPPFETGRRHQYTVFRLAGPEVEDRAATFAELRRAAHAVRSVPQRQTSIGDRAPMVFTTANLRKVLHRVAAALPVAFTIGELDRIFRLALPHFLPGVLDPDERSAAADDGESVDADLVARHSSKLLSRLDSELRVALAMKIAGASDEEVGKQLRVSRRTATNRKARAYEVLEEVLLPLRHGERVAVLERLGDPLRTAVIQSGRRNSRRSQAR